MNIHVLLTQTLEPYGSYTSVSQSEPMLGFQKPLKQFNPVFPVKKYMILENPLTTIVKLFRIVDSRSSFMSREKTKIWYSCLITFND